MVRRVAESLGDLRDQVVFLGGAATALLITDSAIPDVRATIDVDLIVEMASRGDYYRFLDALPGHLLLDQTSLQRITVLKGRMRRIADFKST
jgi:hypothetical protein